MNQNFTCCTVGQCVEKPRGYHGELSPWESPKAKTRGAAGPKGFGQMTSFTMIHPRLFYTFSFFRHPGPVKRDFLHCRQNQPAPREYHTQYYVVDVQTLVELNPNILVQDVERMYIIYTSLASILDLTLSMFIPSFYILTMILPRGSIGWRKSHILARDAKIMTLYDKALGLSWWIESLGRSGSGTALGTPFTTIPPRLC